MLTLIRQVDNNWYEGRSVDGGPSGILPISYVDTLVEPQSVVSTPMSSLAPSPLPGPLSLLISLSLSLSDVSAQRCQSDMPSLWKRVIFGRQGAT